MSSTTVWHPRNLSESCTNPNITACTTMGYVYLHLLAYLYGGSTYKSPTNIDENKDDEEYDFIIVGAGTAGCVVANRLTEVDEWKVLLLEAGLDQPEVTLIPGVESAFGGSNIDWKYSTEPDGKSCLANGGRCSWPRGKVMGGSGSINAMLYVRGHKLDYDNWAALGNDGWSYDEVLPYFKKSENNLNIDALDQEYHNTNGLQSVSYYPYQDLASNLTIQAFVEKGVPHTDFNGKEQFGTGHTQTTSKNGRRVSTNTAFIDPIRGKRKNLTVKTRAEVTEILFNDNNTVCGVIYVRNGKEYFAKARKEVIVSAGAINSPKLLMLSGIGPKKHLNKLNIEIIQDSPVGENLQDHVTFNAPAIILSKETATNFDKGKILEQIVNYKEHQHIFLSYDGPLTATAFIKTSTDLPAPDVKLDISNLNLKEFIPYPVDYGKAKIFPTAFYDGLLVRIMPTETKSRGKLLLKSSDPFESPLLHPNYFGNQQDMDTMLKGMRYLLTLEQTEVFKSNNWTFVREKLPACRNFTWGTDVYHECLVRQYTSSSFHQTGTCKMGVDPGSSVVNPRLAVHGVKGLRVIDASIMPDIPRANTNAPCKKPIGHPASRPPYCKNPPP